MLLNYTTATGESVTLRPTKPFFLTKADGMEYGKYKNMKSIPP